MYYESLVDKESYCIFIYVIRRFFGGFCERNDCLVCFRFVYHGDQDENVTKKSRNSHTKDFNIHAQFFCRLKCNFIGYESSFLDPKKELLQLETSKTILGWTVDTKTHKVSPPQEKSQLGQKRLPRSLTQARPHPKHSRAWRENSNVLRP